LRWTGEETRVQHRRQNNRSSNLFDRDQKRQRKTPGERAMKAVDLWPQHDLGPNADLTWRRYAKGLILQIRTAVKGNQGLDWLL
jgi:phage terminase small subunit